MDWKFLFSAMLGGLIASSLQMHLQSRGWSNWKAFLATFLFCVAVLGVVFSL